MASLQLHEDTKPLVCLAGIHRRQVGGRNENVHKPPGRQSNQDDSPWSHAFIWTRSTLATPPARRGAISDSVGNFGALHASLITFAACATIALHQHSALAQCSTFGNHSRILCVDLCPVSRGETSQHVLPTPTHCARSSKRRPRQREAPGQSAPKAARHWCIAGMTTANGASSTFRARGNPVWQPTDVHARMLP